MPIAEPFGRPRAAQPSPFHVAVEYELDVRNTSADGEVPVARLKRSPSWLQRNGARMTINGLRHSMLTLTATALGGGMLSTSYVMYLSGVGVGLGMLALGALIAFLSTSALMQMSLATGEYSYAGLFAHCAGPRAAPILDAMLFVYGNGTTIGYLVFIADFIPALVRLAFPGAPIWMEGREFAIWLAVMIIAPLVLQREIAMLRHLAPVSLLSLVYVASVIAFKAPGEFSRHVEEHGPVQYYRFGVSCIEAFPLCVFAYNCHLNVVPVAGNLIRPSKARIVKISSGVNVLQFAFYGVIGVAGYLSFLQLTEQDIVANYNDDDRFVAIGRALLTCSMFVGVPMNLFPAVRSAMQVQDYLNAEASAPMLAPSPASSPKAGTARLPTAELSRSAERYRIIMTIGCLLNAAIIAWLARGVADVLSLLGATVATAMMMIIPGYAIGVCMPRTKKNVAKQVFLYFFAFVAMAAVPVKVFKALGMLE